MFEYAEGRECAGALHTFPLHDHGNAGFLVKGTLGR